MQGINSKSYLTRSLLNRIFKKDLTNDDIDDLLMSGTIEKHFSYYKASEGLLRDLKIIPKSVNIPDERFSELAKKQAFVLKEIQQMFDDCHKDTARIIARKYFYKKHNYYYKNEMLIDMLSEGIQEVEVWYD